MNINDRKVLICDDSILARKQIKDILAAFGDLTILEAFDGQTAIDIYKSQKPDLVFLDIVMPKKDGNIVIKEIMAFNKDAIIVVVSSVDTHTQLKCALEAGAADFIQKPFSKEQMVDVINKYLV